MAHSTVDVKKTLTVKMDAEEARQLLMFMNGERTLLELPGAMRVKYAVLVGFEKSLEVDRVLSDGGSNE